MILHAPVQFAESNSLSRLVLDTTDRQEAAQGHYLKNGFIEARREKDDNAVNIYFERTLPNKAIQADAFGAADL